MSSNAPRTQQASGNAAAAPAVAQKEEKNLRRGNDASASEPRRSAGYGLPCSKCRLYYPADLEACPTCSSKQRVAAATPKLPPKSPETAPENALLDASLEKEREEFLKQFKSQLAKTQQETTKDAASACTLAGHRGNEPRKSEICKACYERLQDRLDVCEAALHMDLKEAAHIIYEAVWADPSDPNKTYLNAAVALLGELRKRAGISQFGSFQPLAD